LPASFSKLGLGANAQKLKSHIFGAKYVEFVNKTNRSTNASNTPNQFICYKLKSALFGQDDLPTISGRKGDLMSCHHY